jgi:regulatory protein
MRVRHHWGMEDDEQQEVPDLRLSGELTGLEVQARDQSRVNLYLEGRFAFGVSAKAVADAGLRKGMVLSPDDVAELLKGEAYERAQLQAYNYLSYRGRSEAEMRRYLQGKGHAPETVDAVVGRLRELHYLDDETFALAWVENRQRSRPRGPRLLRSELMQKGVSRETADQAISDVSSDERALALAAAGERAAGLRAADYSEFSRKLGGYLSRRGFSSEVVWSVVKEVWTARRGEAPDDGAIE